MVLTLQWTNLNTVWQRELGPVTDPGAGPRTGLTSLVKNSSHTHHPTGPSGCQSTDHCRAEPSRAGPLAACHYIKLKETFPVWLKGPRKLLYVCVCWGLGCI